VLLSDAAARHAGNAPTTSSSSLAAVAGSALAPRWLPAVWAPPLAAAATTLSVPSRRWASGAAVPSPPAAATPSTSPQHQPSASVTLTPAAGDRIRELVSRPAAVAAGHTALRLTVEAGGCSGFSYVFALDSGPKPGDAVVTAGGAGGGGGGEGGGTVASQASPTLIIDPVSLDLVRGGTVDFVTELIKAGFEVTANPNADGGCGCGASFSPKF